MICDICYADDKSVKECPQCGLKFCVEGGDESKCPQCGATVADNAKCSVSGGCGDGRQEDP